MTLYGSSALSDRKYVHSEHAGDYKQNSTADDAAHVSGVGGWQPTETYGNTVGSDTLA